MAHVPLSDAVPRPTKPKLPTKTKATPTPQCSYSLRARAGSTAAELHQAQPGDSTVSWDDANHGNEDSDGLTRPDPLNFGPVVLLSCCLRSKPVDSSSHICRQSWPWTLQKCIHSIHENVHGSHCITDVLFVKPPCACTGCVVIYCNICRCKRSTAFSAGLATQSRRVQVSPSPRDV